MVICFDCLCVANNFVIVCYDRLYVWKWIEMCRCSVSQALNVFLREPFSWPQHFCLLNAANERNMLFQTLPNSLNLFYGVALTLLCCYFPKRKFNVCCYKLIPLLTMVICRMRIFSWFGWAQPWGRVGVGSLLTAARGKSTGIIDEKTGKQAARGLCKKVFDNLVRQLRKYEDYRVTGLIVN